MPDTGLPNNWYSRFEFKLGVAAKWQLPPDNGAEVAFAGRSNVGKSSVLNKVTQRKALARTSKLPGRTRELNYFEYESGRYLVDLPGYGFARVNEAMQKAWAELLEFYLRERQSLRGLFLIMDIRHPLGKFDRQMLDYSRSCGIPLHILLNKADKLSRGAANNELQRVRHALTRELETCQLFSALKGSGVDEARERLGNWLFLENKKSPGEL